MTKFEADVVSFFVDAADLLGVPKSVAAIYGICFASPEPLSFADINDRLDISQGSISQGVRVLREVGALKVVGTHDRRDYYAPDLELRKLLSRIIDDRVEKQLDSGYERLQSINAAIPAALNGAGNEMSARLNYLEGWHRNARAVIPLVKTFLRLP